MSIINTPIKYDLNKIENKEFKLLIGSRALNIIKLFNSANPNTEWSGILFYELSENDLNFNIEVIDILLMDIGTSTTTGYSFNEDLITFLEENGYLMSYLSTIFIGHVHSHNQMNSFFSGVDINELVENSENHKFYVSLIVNNNLEMVAKAVIKEEITQEIASTGSLGYRSSSITNEYDKEIKKIFKLWCYDAIILREDVTSSLNSHLDRLSYIIKEKSKKIPVHTGVVRYTPNNKKSNISIDKTLNLPNVAPGLILKVLIDTFDTEAATLSQAITNLMASDYTIKDIGEIYSDNIHACLAEHGLDVYNPVVKNQIITQIYHSLAAYPSARDKILIITNSFTQPSKKSKRNNAQQVLNELFSNE